jgi:predicted nucleic acid-binding protein
MPARRDWVVDASVAVKWLVPEPLTAEARRVLGAAREGLIRIHVPELWLTEVASSLWKKTRRAPADRLEVGRAIRMLERVRSLGMTVHSHGVLVSAAFALACRTGLSVCDSLYASLAMAQGFALITADERLASTAREAGLGEQVIPLARVGSALDAMAWL